MNTKSTKKTRRARRLLKYPLIIFIFIFIITFYPTFSTRGFNIDGQQASEDPAKITLLEQGNEIEREIKGGESHTFQVSLSAGQYLRASVEQNGIELFVILYDQADKKLLDIVGWTRYTGTAPVHWIVAETGNYRIRIFPTNKEAVAGRYRVKVEEIRVANDEDRVRVSAQDAFAEANRLNAESSKESRTKAIERFSDALSKYKTINDLYAQGFILQNIASIHDNLGDKQKALDFNNQSLLLRRQLKDFQGEAIVLNNMGRVYDTIGEKRKALDYFNQALPLFKQLGHIAGEASTINNIGLTYATLGERQKALDYFNQALPLRRQVRDVQGEAVTLTNIGIMHNFLGDRRKAIEILSQALLLRRQVRDVQGEAVTLNNIGAIYDNMGEKQKALDHFNQALPLRRKLGDRSGEATTLTNMGVLYENLGESEKALDYYSRALPLRRQVGDRNGEAITLGNIAKLYDTLGERQKALEALDQALLLSRQLGDRYGEAHILTNTGRIYESSGERQKAIDYYNQALAIHRQTGDRNGEATILVNIGVIYNHLGENQKALDNYNQAMSLYKQVGNREAEAITFRNMAKVDNEQDNLASARTNIENAIKNVELVRTSIAGQELRSSFFQTKRDYYELYVDVLMRSHRANPKEGLDSLALQASERSRARGLIELLSEAKIDIREGVDLKLLDREKTLRKSINDKSELLLKLKSRKGAPEQVAQLEKEIEGLISESKEMENQIRSSSPKYAALTQPEAISFKDIQQLLDPDTLLLEYSFGDKRSYLWLVSQNSLTGYELPSRKDIEDKAREFYNSLTLPIRDAQANSSDYKKPAAELGKMLLGPAEKELGKKRLLVVAEGALQYIPFSALSLQAEQYAPLILDHEIANIPSVSTLAVQRRELGGRPAAGKLLAVLADPVFDQDDPRLKQNLAQRKPDEQLAENTKRGQGDELDQAILLRSAEGSGLSRVRGFARLLGSRREANAIAALADKEKVLNALDFDASRDTVTSQELSQYRFVHIATHGLLNSKNPELSGVVLSLVDKEGNPQKGFLKLNEIYNLKLNAELVVLSGCQTGLGKEIRGEGMVGLTRGFMYAGARSIVASLWNVQDFTTSELMTRFYQAMLKEGKKPAEALRQAQIEMLKKGQKSNPYFWAGFTFQGDWR